MVKFLLNGIEPSTLEHGRMQPGWIIGATASQVRPDASSRQSFAKRFRIRRTTARWRFMVRAANTLRATR